MPLYRLFVPKQAVGANLVYFDLWHPAATGHLLVVRSCTPVASSAVAVSIAVGIDVLLTRTSAIGTGGTAAVREGADTTAMTFTAQDSSQPFPAAITARLTPSGGATAGAVLGWRSLMTEETQAGIHSMMPDLAAPGVLVPGGTGIRVVQGAVASAGNVGFDLLLELIQVS